MVRYQGQVGVFQATLPLGAGRHAPAGEELHRRAGFQASSSRSACRRRDLCGRRDVHSSGHARRRRSAADAGRGHDVLGRPELASATASSTASSTPAITPTSSPISGRPFSATSGDPGQCGAISPSTRGSAKACTASGDGRRGAVLQDFDALDGLERNRVQVDVGVVAVIVDREVGRTQAVDQHQGRRNAQAAQRDGRAAGAEAALEAGADRAGAVGRDRADGVGGGGDAGLGRLSEVSTVTGEGVSVLVRRNSEPVTTILRRLTSASAAAGAAAGVAAAGCAQAGVEATVASGAAAAAAGFCARGACL